jgi:DNA-binding NarL/FixJ family response regulator
LPEAPRVCVIDCERLGPAYPQLDRCKVDVRASLPRFMELPATLLTDLDVIVIGCDERALLSPRFEESVRRMAALKPIIAVAAEPTPRVATLAARSGFHGLVARDVPPGAFDRTIAAVRRGELAFPRSTTLPLARSPMARPPSGDGRDAVKLTGRQRQVVELIAQGATDRQIGETLGISASTAHKHVLAALRRFNARTRGQLIAAVGST